MNEQKVNESCLSCKITSITCLVGIGSYLIHSSRTYKGTTKIFITTLGAGILCLGIGEIFDKSPFRNKVEE